MVVGDGAAEEAIAKKDKSNHTHMFYRDNKQENRCSTKIPVQYRNLLVTITVLVSALTDTAASHSSPVTHFQSRVKCCSSRTVLEVLQTIRALVKLGAVVRVSIGISRGAVRARTNGSSSCATTSSDDYVRSC